ncbi:MAG: VOC family protein [Terricaulis sp.]
MSSKSYDVGGVRFARPFHIQRLGHIGLSQTDLEACTDFWVDNLGFRKTDALQPPGIPRPLGWFTTYGADHHALVQIDALLEQGGPHYARGITVNQISFQVGTLKEVADANAYFKENGIETWRYGRDFPGSNWAVYAYDPDGFRVELFYGIEQIGWDRRSKPVQLYSMPDYTPQLPERAELSEIKAAETNHPNMGAGFRPAEDAPFAYDVGGVMLQRPFAINRLGPVYLFVEDVDRSEAFYTRHFGLVCTETIIWRGHRAAFLRHGADHHVIGLFPAALRGTLELDQRTKLFSFGIELGSYQQLRDAVAWLRRRGLQVRTDLPRELRPGIDYAALVQDPSGHAALLYCGMEQVGWEGKPRAAGERREVLSEWPETLDAMSDTYASLSRQGPMA